MFPNCDKKSLYGASELRQNKIISDLNSEINIETTYRQVSLDLGKIGRSYNNLFWVAHLAKDYASFKDWIKAYVVADARFIDEMKWLKNNQFKLIKIKRKQDFRLIYLSFNYHVTLFGY